uniref:Uncharacterized protein n=1 Tax=Brassica oleracea TaxID=3712 RepID=A0A3P6HE67_BRAOL|nr:unnamed protein product [Brassica oleracea]
MLALPVDCPWGNFRPRGLSVGDFRHEDRPSVHISARCPSRDYPIFATRLTVRG